MPRFGFVALALLLAVSQPAAAQKKSARTQKPRARPAPEVKKPAAIPTPEPVELIPTPDSLAAISERGRALAERDSIAWLGSDAMTSLSVPADGIRRLIVRRTSDSWEVALGKLSDDESAFYVQEIATPGIQKDRWASTPIYPPQPSTDYYFRAATAIQSAVTMFHAPEKRPYIATAILAPEGAGWFVYLYPAPTEEGVYPRGGDMRFRVSADGHIITESRRLHESISEYSVRTARPASALIDRGVVVSGNTPEDTDVFHVLQRRPAIPELMIAGKYRYRIDVDGTIRLLPNN